MTATPLCLMLVLAVASDAVNDLLAKAARFPHGAVRYEGFEEDLTAAVNAQLALTDLARDCPEAEWAALRDRLVASLDSENRGVWMACCQALSRRDPEALAGVLLATLQAGCSPGREALAAGALGRIGRTLGPDTRSAAAAVLAERIEDRSQPCDLERMLNALGSMGEPATDHLLRIAADAALLARVRSALPNALASTEDVRAMPVLLSLHQGAVTEGERTTALLALGQLARRLAEEESPVDAAIAAIRADLESHPSPAIAAAAALALARAGYLHAESDGARMFQLASDAEARKSALRAVLESRMPLDDEQRQFVETYVHDAGSSPAVRKIARALLAE